MKKLGARRKEVCMVNVRGWWRAYVCIRERDCETSKDAKGGEAKTVFENKGKRRLGALKTGRENFDVKVVLLHTNITTRNVSTRCDNPNEFIRPRYRHKKGK